MLRVFCLINTMNNQPLEKLQLKIHGMHCASCEVLIERKFKKISGIAKVDVSHTNGKAELSYFKEPKLHELQNAIKQDGYTISFWNERNAVPEASCQNTKKDYFQIGAIFLIIVALYLILREFNLVPKLGITENMSYGFVFLIGLVAAMSTCLAVTGGLLLAVAAKYNERFPYLTGIQKLKPHLYFNAGRIVSYTAFGGVIGLLGSMVTFSPKATGFMTIGASMVMIILGFQLLKLFPWMKRFQPKPPKFLAHKIHDMSGKDSKFGPFLLGAGTFFLPCGFTQALQLYVLSQGGVATGALTMLAFSLGTLPALMSLSAISSFAKGAFQKYFLKFAGVAVILLGSFNVQNGFTLAGLNINLASVFAATDKQDASYPDANARVVDGKQIVNMKVVGLDYEPSQFIVAEGVPVEWNIEASQAEGCGQVISVPRLGIVKYLSPQGITKISFTPQGTGDIPFSCTMGMTTRGSKFTVVPNTSGIVPALSAPVLNKNPTECNPEIMNCIEAQKLNMEVSRELGFYPRSFTVKKGVPVELTIDDQIPLGGCMSVMVIPEYNVTIPLKVGQNKVKFIPNKAGTTYATCSMGSRMAQFVVTD